MYQSVFNQLGTGFSQKDL